MRSPSPFPIAGVGASAGGLESFSQLLASLPVESGMAFVLIQHLDPNHPSQLADLLSRATQIPVVEAREGMPVTPDRVHVIPPGSDMTIEDGILRLTPRAAGSGLHLPIDRFFRSLAGDQQDQAIGVVLSGSGSDGSVGLGEIKAAGGITFAQEPQSAKHSGMPLSAIDSGSVDLVLPPDGIARELGRIGQRRLGRVAPVEESSVPSDADESNDEARAYERIIALLRSGSGVDFAGYRDATIRRRIGRRMVLNQKDSLSEYALFLEQNRSEIDALYRDILINVTRFFRDPEVFEVLKSVVFPVILKGKSPEVPIRIWVPGCSSGQEAYSLAISLLEFLEQQPMRPPIQIFGTDISDIASIERARVGLYPDNISSDVSPERLRRFFTKEEGGYRIGKAIREMCVFAKQNVAVDPPFSKLDLISCRNLLIYVSAALQQRIIPIFHYALNPDGFLLLGTSEGIGRFADLFALIDKQYKIHVRLAGVTRSRSPYFTEGRTLQTSAAGVAPGDRPPSVSDLGQEADRIILGRFAPAGVLVNESLEILQFRGRTAPYLEPAPGAASLDLLKMARDFLFLDLRSAVEESRKEGVAVRREGVEFRDADGVRPITLEVIPVKLPGGIRGGFLVLFEQPARAGEEQTDSDARLPALPPPSEGELEHLRRELAAVREYVDSIIEQQSATNEEMRSANEEVLSANEELQSTNEELQTAKEELQSTNEELVTVNEELMGRNLEVGQVNDDLNNLLSSTKIPIVMVGRDLRIRRFTPDAGRLLNLVVGDIGRPITQIRPVFEIPGLEALLLDVMATVVVQERELQDPEGNWYTLRVHPYRTADHRIDGVLLVFWDISESKKTRELLLESRDYSAAIVDTVRDPLLVLDADLRVKTANRSYRETFRVSSQETEGRLVYELGNGQWHDPKLRRLFEGILSARSSFADFEVEHDFPRIGRRTILIDARRLFKERKHGRSILVAFRDITERKHLERQVRDQMALVIDANAAKDQFLAALSHELRTPLTPVLMTASALEARRDLPDDIREQITILRRNVGLETRLIDDLLDLTRIVRGKLETEQHPQDFGALLKHTLEICRGDLEAKELHLSLDMRLTDPWVMGDGPRLQQVFWNLIRNAIKFTPRQGHIDLSCFNQPDRVVLQVIDNGMGIAPDVLPRLFDPFEQGPQSITRQFGGLGLGLAIAKAIVDQHHGRLRAESLGKDRGATFTLELPTSPEAAQAIMARKGDSEPAASASPAPARMLRILVVEDHGDTARLMVRLLESMDHTVRTAGDVAGAKRLAAEHRFDLVISDLGLPDGDGVDLMRYLREEHGLVGIALTGHGMEKDRIRTREAGFLEHLVKPIRFDQLQQAIARASCE